MFVEPSTRSNLSCGRGRGLKVFQMLFANMSLGAVVAHSRRWPHCKRMRAAQYPPPAALLGLGSLPSTEENGRKRTQLRRMPAPVPTRDSFASVPSRCTWKHARALILLAEEDEISTHHALPQLQNEAPSDRVEVLKRCHRWRAGDGAARGKRKSTGSQQSQFRMECEKRQIPIPVTYQFLIVSCGRCYRAMGPCAHPQTLLLRCRPQLVVFFCSPAPPRTPPPLAQSASGHQRHLGNRTELFQLYTVDATNFSFFSRQLAPLIRDDSSRITK